MSFSTAITSVVQQIARDIRDLRASLSGTISKANGADTRSRANETKVNTAQAAADAAQSTANTAQTTANTAVDATVQLEANKLGMVTSDVTITVGPGGQYARINAAMEQLAKKYPTHSETPASATIRLLDGFIMREQVIIRNGVDLSWITITADAAITTIYGSYITEALTPLDGMTPAFGIVGTGRLPKIGCLFRYDGNGSQSKDGVGVYGHGASVEFAPGAGIQNCKNGIKLYHGGVASCIIDGFRGDSELVATQGVDFRECSQRALDCQYGGKAHLPRSNFSYCGGSMTVYVIWGNSEANIYQSNMSHSAGEAVLVRDSGRADCRECDVSNSQRGFHALHGGYINARSKATGSSYVGGGASNCSQYAVMATYASTIECPELNCDDCGNIAIHVDLGSFVNAEKVSARRAGSKAVNCINGSTINANESSFDDAVGDGVYVDHGSKANIYNSTARRAGQTALFVNNGSIVGARNFNANNSNHGITAQNASIVGAYNCNVSNCTRECVTSESGASVSVDNGQGWGSGASSYSAVVALGGDISARDFDLHDPASHGMFAKWGGRINAAGANVENANSNAFISEGGTIAAHFAKATGSVNSAYRIFRGGVITAYNATGTLGATANTLTSNGVIYQ